MDEVMFKSC